MENLNRIFRYLNLLLLIIITMTVAFTLVSSSGHVSAGTNSISVLIGDEEVEADSSFRREDGRLLVPARPIFEGLGAQMIWDEDERVATGIKGEHRVDIPIDSKKALVNKQVHELDVPGRIFDGRTYIPLRFSGEAFGAEVDWNSNSQTVEITSSSKLVESSLEKDPPKTLASTNTTTKEQIESTDQTSKLDSSNVVFSINLSGDDNVIFEVDTKNGYALIKTESNGQLDLEDKKIMVEKDDDRYFYDLSLDNKTGITFQLGSGDYEMALLKHSSGDNYSVVKRKTVEVNLINDVVPFLNSTWPVNWNQESEASKLAQTLVNGLENDRQKVESIYKFVVENISYDYEKINRINNDYVPHIDTVLNEKTGICYDYSALFAGMLRSLDIPTKLVKGYQDDLKEYHSWNEVYIEDENEWILIDTTYDAGLNQTNGSVEMNKDRSDYQVNKIY